MVGSNTSITWRHIGNCTSRSRNIIATYAQKSFTDETDCWNIKRGCIIFFQRYEILIGFTNVNKAILHSFNSICCLSKDANNALTFCFTLYRSLIDRRVWSIIEKQYVIIWLGERKRSGKKEKGKKGHRNNIHVLRNRYKSVITNAIQFEQKIPTNRWSLIDHFLLLDICAALYLWD